MFRSRNDLRFYLLRGIVLGTLLALAVFVGSVQQVYRTSSQTLPTTATADAVVMLGAATWSKRPSPVFLGRISHAIALYQSHRVDKIAFTGGTLKKGCMTEAEVGRRYALEQGIPIKNILSENTSRNTYENLRNIKPILRASSIDSIIIINNPYHLTRAQAIAHDLDLDVEVSVTSTIHFDARGKRGRFLFQESYLLFLYQLEGWGDRIRDWITRNG